MPSYDYKCRDCGAQFIQHYKTIAEYEAAQPTCPACGSSTVQRKIGGVAVKKSAHDYTRMSSNEMLSVLESGNSRQVGEMFQQVGGGDPRLGQQYHDTTEQLLKGEKKDKVEGDLKDQSKPDKQGGGEG